MKKLLTIVLCSFVNALSSQTFWTENFNTGAGWTLANVTGAEGSDPNFFQITANEGGNITPNMGAPTSCGVANNGNNTMHVTSVFFPAGGAAYDAGGLCGFWFCPQANRRAQSPVINCTGQTSITITFAYIEGGQGTSDNATFWYFNGSTWAQLDDMPKTATGCSGQGLWVTRSIALPASANNNANVRIGFRWVNNDDGVGTDPSFAVDNISASTSVILPVDLVSFNVGSNSGSIRLSWTAFNAMNFDGFSIERSSDGAAYSQIGYLKSGYQDRDQHEYYFADNNVTDNTWYYYRLRCTDKDGSFRYSEVRSAKTRMQERDIQVYFNGYDVVLKHTGDIRDFNNVELLDITGKIISSQPIHFSEGQTLLNGQNLGKGIYLCRLANLNESKTIKVSVW